MNGFFYVPLVLFTVAFAALLSFRRTRILGYEQLVARVGDYRLSDLFRFVDGESWDADDQAFWAASGGFKGAIKRLHTSTLLLNICQLGVRDRLITPQDCNEVLRLARLQVFYTVLAIPEALACSLLPGRLPHISARVAPKFCAEVLARTRTLTDQEASPYCLTTLGTQ